MKTCVLLKPKSLKYCYELLGQFYDMEMKVWYNRSHLYGPVLIKLVFMSKQNVKMLSRKLVIRGGES